MPLSITRRERSRRFDRYAARRRPADPVVVISAFLTQIEDAVVHRSLECFHGDLWPATLRTESGKLREALISPQGLGPTYVRRVRAEAKVQWTQLTVTRRAARTASFFCSG